MDDNVVFSFFKSDKNNVFKPWLPKSILIIT